MLQKRDKNRCLNRSRRTGGTHPFDLFQCRLGDILTRDFRFVGHGGCHSPGAVNQMKLGRFVPSTQELRKLVVSQLEFSPYSS